MPSDEQPVDVAAIMRRIRDDTRTHNREVVSRIDQVHGRLEARYSLLADGGLRRRVEQLNDTFDQHYRRAEEILNSPDPQRDSLRHTVWLISQIVGDPDAQAGPRDRWWNHLYWAKRTLRPLRRFVLRRQYEMNAHVLNALIDLTNRSSDFEATRNDLLATELQWGVQLIQTANDALDVIEMLARYTREWPEAALSSGGEYLVELNERAHDRLEQLTTATCQQLTDLHNAARERFDESLKQQTAETQRLQENYRCQLEEFSEGWGERVASVARQAAAAATPSKAPVIMGFDNLDFAEGLRGSEQAILGQQRYYLNYLHGQDNVLDAGCGRGEFLELMREVGIPCYGVDLDERMVEECREKGLEAQHGDIMDHLAGLRDKSLGGLVALQLIEHLDFARLFEFLRLAGVKVRPGGVILLETVNPSCLTTFSGAFYADPTHQRPIHPAGARRLLEMFGFTDIRVDFSNPVDEAGKLIPLTPDSSETDPALQNLVDSLNENIRRINSVLYGFADYAVIGRKAIES